MRKDNFLTENMDKGYSKGSGDKINADNLMIGVIHD